MDKARYLTCLESDYRRLREVAAGRLDAKVPTCPEWTMTDLVRHTAQVYLHKTEIIRTGATPTIWPPDLSGQTPVDALDRAYTGLVAELTTREPDALAPDWYEPDPTVGFWVRRMAQETVIHRVDGELAAGVAIAAIPEDLALDGIDEVLVCFMAYGSAQWPDYMGDLVSGSDGRPISVDAGSQRWTVRIAPTGVEVTRDNGSGDARVSGSPQDVLLWLWRRSETIGKEGDEKLLTRLWDLLGATTV